MQFQTFGKGQKSKDPIDNKSIAHSLFHSAKTCFEASADNQTARSTKEEELQEKRRKKSNSFDWETFDTNLGRDCAGDASNNAESSLAIG